MINLYKRLKSKILDYFNFKKKFDFSEEQLDYILSGMSLFIRKNYHINYSPSYISFFNKERRPFRSLPKKNLERKLSSKYPGDYNENSIKNLRSLYLHHIKRLQEIQADHFKRLNEIYSRVIEAYNKGMNNLKDVFVENQSDGSLVFRFV